MNVAQEEKPLIIAPAPVTSEAVITTDERPAFSFWQRRGGKPVALQPEYDPDRLPVSYDPCVADG